MMFNFMMREGVCDTFIQNKKKCMKILWEGRGNLKIIFLWTSFLNDFFRHLILFVICIELFKLLFLYFWNCWVGGISKNYLRWEGGVGFEFFVPIKKFIDQILATRGVNYHPITSLTTPLLPNIFKKNILQYLRMFPSHSFFL